MKSSEIEPGTYYRVRLHGRGELEDVRAERVEIAYPRTDSKTKVLIATRHFALRDVETRHSLRDVLQVSDPARIAKLKRFLTMRDRLLAEDPEAEAV